jgi:hypothetical protein
MILKLGFLAMNTLKSDAMAQPNYNFSAASASTVEE